MKAQWITVALAVLIGAPLEHADAQQQSVTVKPSEQYRGSSSLWWGTGHRELWQTFIRVPVLHLQRFRGGLYPVKEGGGKQTATLHLRGADGRNYVFRSVDKDSRRTLPAGFAQLGIAGLASNGTASLHPSGALIVAPLFHEVGVLHVRPRLYYMPPEAPLGKFSERFAGMLGLLEERPEEGDDGAAGFAGSRSVVGTDKLQQLLRADSRNRIQQTDWLAARLIDFLAGDTDRGPDQWRWARFDDGDGFRWRPVPRDHDFAFINADGLLLRAIGTFTKRLVTFTDELPRLGSLTFSSLDIDRQFLHSLDSAAWTSIVENVEMKLADEVIDRAVRAMPREHYAVSGANITANLRSRRGQLPAMARRFYRQLAQHVDVQGSDQAELAEIRREADGSVTVMVYRNAPDLVSATGNGYGLARVRRAFYVRRFNPSETEEIRVYLLGGDDRVVVFGPNVESGIKVRIIGGDGIDELVDASEKGEGGTRTWLYDDRARNRFIRGKHTRIDHRPFVDPPPEEDFVGGKIPYRDWGGAKGFGPALDYRENTGFIVGAQYHEREYGFRRFPFATDWRAQMMWAPSTGGIGAALEAEQHFENSRWRIDLEMRASQYDDLRFFGYGNDTRDVESDSTRVEWSLGQATGGFRHEAENWVFGAGVSMHVSDTPLTAGTPLAAINPLGTGKWAQFGMWSDVTASIGDNVRLELEAAAFPAAASLTEPYAKAGATAVAYIGSAPILALRASGDKRWGSVPYFDAAFTGGRKLLRGYSAYRFAGDAALVGNAELRIPLARGHLGLIALADAGRVYVDGASPDGWHSAYGGGFWLSLAGHTVAATYANGEHGSFYITLGTAY